MANPYTQYVETEEVLAAEASPSPKHMPAAAPGNVHHLRTPEISDSTISPRYRGGRTDFAGMPNDVDDSAAFAASTPGGHSAMPNASRRIRPAPASSTLDDDLSQYSPEIDISEIQIRKEDLLGSGSFGSVYKGMLRGKEVAIKKLHVQNMEEAALSNFKKEVAIMYTLRHPNVVLFMGACTSPGNLLIVTEFCPLGSVHSLLRDPKKGPKISFKQKMKFAKDAALGMNYIHSNDPAFLHLDLKTGNLLVDANYRVKIADFGLSVMQKRAPPIDPATGRLIESSEHAETPSKYGPIGTPLWMAPEVLLNQEYTTKADVYSFGIVLWELLTIEEPWRGVRDLSELVRKVCFEHKRPAIPDQIPTLLRELINSCWAPDPTKRPSFRKMLEDNVFDEIALNFLVTDRLGRRLWKAHWLTQDIVPWEEFCAVFSQEALGVQQEGENDMRFVCLRAAVVDQKKGGVTLENYSRLLHCFGPLQGPGPHGADVLVQLEALLRKAWFHGEISSKEAEDRVKNQKPGTFLFRFSSDPGCYAITVLVEKGKIRHHRIYHKCGLKYFIGQAEADSLDSIIATYSKQLGMKYPAEGSFYQAMFKMYEQAKGNQLFGYLDPNAKKK